MIEDALNLKKLFALNIEEVEAPADSPH